jgi:uncharacterized membrane protein YqhA
VAPFGSKALFGMAGVTLIVSIAYGIRTNDGSATSALGFIAIGAFVLGLLVVFADPDRAPWYAPDAPIAQQSPSGGRPSLPSAWPLVWAAALAVLAIAAATDAVLVGTATVLMVVAAIGWFFQHFSEHPTYSSRYAARLKERLVVPIGLPVAVLILLAIIAGSLSRIFLALPEQGTRAAALAVALIILVSAFAIAASDRIARTALALLCSFALLCAVGGGVVGLVNGEHHFEVPKTKPFHGPVPPGVTPALIGAGAKAGTATTTTSTTP